MPWSLPPYVLQAFDELFDGESRRSGAGDEIAHQLLELALPLATVALWFAVRDERSRALLRIDHTADFELAVGAHYRVRIDGEIDGDLPHGGELLARRKRGG